MAILGCNFDINFGQTLAPGSSLSNTLRTKLHAWNESSIIVVFIVKFIWQLNLPVEFYGTFKMTPERLDFLCSKGKKWGPPPPCNSKTESQRSQPNWRLKYLMATNFCAKFQPNRLTTSFWPLEHFLHSLVEISNDVTGYFRNFVCMYVFLRTTPSNPTPTSRRPVSVCKPLCLWDLRSESFF